MTQTPFRKPGLSSAEEQKLKNTLNDVEQKILEDSVKGINFVKKLVEKTKGFCKVIGCSIKTRKEYCKPCAVKVKAGKIYEDVPVYTGNRIVNAFFYIRDCHRAIDEGLLTEEQAKDNMFRDMSKLFKTLDIAKVTTTGKRFMEHDERFNPTVKEHAVAIESKKRLRKKLAAMLSYVPLDFKIGDIKSDSETLQITLLTRLDNKRLEELGYLDANGLFIERSVLLKIMNKAFRTGTEVSLHTYGHTFSTNDA